MEHEPPISNVWGKALDYLDSILNRLAEQGELSRVTREWELRELLERASEAFSEEPGAIPRVPRYSDLGIFDPEARGGCVKLLLVPCSYLSFYKRAFDVADIAQNCKPMLKGVIFLPVSWTQHCENRLATHVSSMLRKNSVIQICVKFPLLAPHRCY